MFVATLAKPRVKPARTEDEHNLCAAAAKPRTQVELRWQHEGGARHGEQRSPEEASAGLWMNATDKARYILNRIQVMNRNKKTGGVYVWGRQAFEVRLRQTSLLSSYYQVAAQVQLQIYELHKWRIELGSAQVYARCKVHVYMIHDT